MFMDSDQAWHGSVDNITVNMFMFKISHFYSITIVPVRVFNKQFQFRFFFSASNVLWMLFVKIWALEGFHLLVWETCSSTSQINSEWFAWEVSCGCSNIVLLSNVLCAGQQKSAILLQCESWNCFLKIYTKKHI